MDAVSLIMGIKWKPRWPFRVWEDGANHVRTPYLRKLLHYEQQWNSYQRATREYEEKKTCLDRFLGPPEFALVWEKELEQTRKELLE